MGGVIAVLSKEVGGAGIYSPAAAGLAFMCLHTLFGLVEPRGGIVRTQTLPTWWYCLVVHKSHSSIDVQRSHHPYRHAGRSCTLHVNVGGGGGGGGQFISGADRIFQHKPAIYGPGDHNYVSGDHIFRDRPSRENRDPLGSPFSR